MTYHFGGNAAHRVQCFFSYLRRGRDGSLGDRNIRERDVAEAARRAGLRDFDAKAFIRDNHRNSSDFFSRFFGGDWFTPSLTIGDLDVAQDMHRGQRTGRIVSRRTGRSVYTRFGDALAERYQDRMAETSSTWRPYRADRAARREITGGYRLFNSFFSWWGGRQPRRRPA